MADQQTEKATPKRRQQAREQGQVVRSRELTASLVLLGGCLFLRWFAGAFVSEWRTVLFTVMEQAVHCDFSVLAGNQALFLVRASLLPALFPVELLMGGLFSVAALVSVAQSGGIAVKQDAFTPQFSRLSPASYSRQVFSFTGLARLLKSLVPTLFMLFLAWRLVSSQFLSTPLLSLMRVPEMYQEAYSLLMQASCLMLGWSGLDYLVEWWTHEQSMRMSKQDIRDEMKQTEGSPQVRRRIRSIQRQMRRRQLRADVSRASVVITNPTHYAVALEFSFETMQAPKVLAKGRNLIAEQMKQEARWAGVPIVENPPLARSLYRSVEPGQSIPYDLYAMVAEILAFLYRAELEQRARERVRAERRRSKQTHGTPPGQSAPPENLQQLGPGSPTPASASLPPPNANEELVENSEQGAPQA
jgi:flagellar biosynthetic protein FlhB